MQSAAERKASLRAEVWRRRRALPVAARDEAGTRIATHGLEWAARVVPDHGTLTAYLGVGSEPPTLPLLGQLFERGYHVLLPICEPERRLSWVEWRPDIAYARSRYAPIQEPVGPQLGTAALRTG
ncbi:MAG: 5-formyltetrahydrofolate cyclo-ligase, partial [Sinomonas sp.]|nr:5-formyltetrahydrofolate cyclo-ligase [Sinomonas sp.]